MGIVRRLNLRDIGDVEPSAGGEVPRGLLLRSGKLSVLSREECARLCRDYDIRCVVDLRTPVEAMEFPDPLPDGVEYVRISLLADAAVGITHETGSDAMTIIRRLRRHPEKLKEMVPDFEDLYRRVVTDRHCRTKLDEAVRLLRRNATEGRCTLFHCTAGKDRTGLVSMALLKSYGIGDEAIVSDYLRTNRNAFFPTLKKCVGVALLTQNWSLVKTAYRSFMADRHLIETAIRCYDGHGSS